MDKEIIDQVLKHARSLHPKWPNDPIHGAAIVAEESGELVRATLNHRYEGNSLSDCKKEALHVLATAVRFLEETAGL